jgi:hypothetical protein
VQVLYDDGFGSLTVKDYFTGAKVLCRDDGGPPRWFSPVECGHPAVDQAPLLLFFPGACVSSAGQNKSSQCLSLKGST